MVWGEARGDGGVKIVCIGGQMIIIGLTGSIGMGKSTVARLCEILGAKTISADAIVHELMKPSGAAFVQIQKSFPACIQEGRVDRKMLGGMVFNDDAARKKLETILHPLVIEAEERWVRAQQKLGTKWVVLDIPLLFETGGEVRMDITMLATAPAFVQKQRVLARTHMSEEKYACIIKAQMPDREKRNYADFVVHTGLGKGVTMRQLKLLLERIR